MTPDKLLPADDITMEGIKAVAEKTGKSMLEVAEEELRNERQSGYMEEHIPRIKAAIKKIISEEKPV